MKITDLIREIIATKLNEILDYDESKVTKKVASKLYNEPISGTKVIKIDGTTIKTSFLIDEFDNSLEVSFSDENNSFEALTNNNIIGKIFSNVTFHSLQFLKDIDKKIKGKNIISIDKIVFTPTKIKGIEDSMKVSDTKRGKLYIFFIKKVLNIKSIKSDNSTIQLYLEKPIKLGKDLMNSFQLKN